MSTLTLADVEKIAMLARLHLTAEEKEKYRQQLSAVLDYVAAIDELDLDDLPPTTHAVSQHNILRPDRVSEALPVEQALANAASTAENQFAIQAVLDE